MRPTCARSYSVMVITKDSDSFNPGSSPGRTYSFAFRGLGFGKWVLCNARPRLPSLWPNWIRRLTTNQKIGGSSPSRDSFLFLFRTPPVPHAREARDLADIAQLGERQTEDLKVPGSIPGVGTFWHLGRVVKAID